MLRLRSKGVNIVPGLVASLSIAYFSTVALSAVDLALINPIALAMLAGVVLRMLVGKIERLAPGMEFSMRPVLQAAVVLLGFQLTIEELLSLGPGVIALAVACVVLTTTAVGLLGWLLCVDPKLTRLIGAGTAICGASAIVAVNQVVRAKQEDVAYALAAVTLFGTATMMIFPYLGQLFVLDSRTYGLWAGASIHEVVQAVGAATAGGPEALEAGTVTKLIRVIQLGPFIIMLAWWQSRGPSLKPTFGIAIPWFAVVFLALICVNSLGVIPTEVRNLSRPLVTVMLGAAVAALGYSVDLNTLGQRGIVPILLSFLATIFICVVALMGVLLINEW